MIKKRKEPVSASVNRSLIRALFGFALAAEHLLQLVQTIAVDGGFTAGLSEVAYNTLAGTV